ncbi:MAG: amidase family protein, partial [Egibacteraceae bacterium]
MAVRRPTPEDLARIARDYAFTIPQEQMPAVEAVLEAAFIAPYDRLDELEEPKAEPRYPRDGGTAPRPEENPLGAWAWRVRVEGAPDGPLAGKTVAIKDNVAVAGVPMRNGTAILDGYVPDEDATVVQRVLDAGATVLGKAACESLCFSGGSHTGDAEPVRNPHDPSRTTGGSSSGSGALVAAGEVDMAIGGDQG